MKTMIPFSCGGPRGFGGRAWVGSGGGLAPHMASIAPAGPASPANHARAAPSAPWGGVEKPRLTRRRGAGQSRHAEIPVRWRYEYVRLGV